MRGSFYGWYLKCQSDTQTLAVVFLFHIVKKNDINKWEEYTPFEWPLLWLQQMR